MRNNGFNDGSILHENTFSVLRVYTESKLYRTKQGITICQNKHAAEALCLPPLAQ